MRQTKKVLGLMLAVLIAVMAFTGCQAEEAETVNESEQQIDQSETNESETKTESEIIVGEAVDFASYEPISGFDGQGFYHYSGLVYETLVNLEDGQLQSGLAKEWEVEDNTITLYLREDVQFTDGEPFNAEVVKLNIEKLQELVPNYLVYYCGISTISDVEIIDDYTVRFVYPNAYYPAIQDMSAMFFGMLSPNMFDNGNNPYGSTLTDTAGTGPYVLKTENIKERQEYTFVRNENYYQEADGPDKLTVTIIPDADARALAMENGEIDLLFGAYQVTYDMFDQLDGSGDIEAVLSEKTYSTRNILLNTSRDITGDVKVRQAISYGTDKQQIVDTILHGMDEKADALFSDTVPFCNVEGLETYDYDVEKANALLDEAGWAERNDDGIRMKNGVTLTLEATYKSARPTEEQILMAFKGQMAEIGVDVQITGYEALTWYQNSMNGEFDLTMNDTYGLPQDPYVFMNAMLNYGVDYPAQQGLTEKAEIDQRISETLTTLDESVFEDAYAYVLTILNDEAVNIPIAFKKEVAIINTQKIESIGFSDINTFCDIRRIVLVEED